MDFLICKFGVLSSAFINFFFQKKSPILSYHLHMYSRVKGLIMVNPLVIMKTGTIAAALIGEPSMHPYQGVLYTSQVK